jgi:hypothetical protein
VRGGAEICSRGEMSRTSGRSDSAQSALALFSPVSFGEAFALENLELLRVDCSRTKSADL